MALGPSHERGLLMTSAPAPGEQSALHGYRWQYDHIAALVYDALVVHDFEELRLADPTAGRVDDVVLIRGGRIDAYQFKSGSGYITFRGVVRKQRTRGGKEAPSLVRSLADGWRSLQVPDTDTSVHLVTGELASVNDDLSAPDTENKPSPKHFHAFLARVLEPLRSSLIEVTDVPEEWSPALESLQDASGLEADDFCRFLRALHFDVGAGAGLPASPSRRRSDIIQLSNALYRLVSEASDVVRLDTRGVLDLVGWTGRTTLQSPHEFPVDLETYSPLTAAIDELNEVLVANDRGYVALIGPPGSGKSTLLSQALTGIRDRVIHYYAYVPGVGPSRTRLSARSFLHDLVLMLNQKGFDTYERQLASGDVTELRRQLSEQLEAASERFEADGRRTIVIVDGLDHVCPRLQGR